MSTALIRAFLSRPHDRHVIDRILDEYPILADLEDGVTPVYCLPKSLLEHLSGSRPGLEYFRVNRNAEMRLTDVVAAQSLRIGYFRGQFISTPLINNSLYRRDTLPPVEERYRGEMRAEWESDPERAEEPWYDGDAVDQAESDFERERERLRAVAAALLLDAEFRADHDNLWQQWRALPEEYTLPFWLKTDPRRLVPPGEWGDCEECEALEGIVVPPDNGMAEMINAWNRNLTAFLDKYALTTLSFWGMPQPVGTHMMPGPLVDNLALRSSGPVIYTHQLFPLTPRDDRLNAMEDLQEVALQQSPLARLRKAAKYTRSYSHLFLFMHFEESILRRLPGGEVPVGTLQYIEEGIAAFVGISLSTWQAARSRLKLPHYRTAPDHLPG